MTTHQLPLEPTAIEEALEEAVATGKEPDWVWGLQRDKAMAKVPAPDFAEYGMRRFQAKFGALPDIIWCCPENVERLTHLPGVRVYNGARVWHPDTFFFGRVGLAPLPLEVRR